jgi:hypothetical protein
LAHSAFAKQRQDFVRADTRAGCEWQRAGAL